MNDSLQPPTSGQAGCAILGHAFVESSLSGVAALRDGPPPASATHLPARFLRHSDEHTVVAVHAVLAVMASVKQAVAFDRCGVVAAPCQAGRIMTARSLSMLRTGGAVMVSPHIVPQCSLHSLAGAVSVALGMHGPHLGVGGGPDALAEGLFSAMSLFQPGAASGCDAAWLIVTEWASEPELDASGAALGDPVCRAVAMLLAPAAVADAPLVLSLHLPPAMVATVTEDGMGGDLVAFTQALDICGSGAALASWTVTCPWGAQIRVSKPEPAALAVSRRRPAGRVPMPSREAA
jgi:hypothetical protein